MADVRKYGGSGGSDFPDARREPAEATYDSSAHHDMRFYGDEENPESSAPGAPGVPGEEQPPMTGAARVQDILDETTVLTDDSKYILTGKNLVNHMSSIAPYCLDTDQMSLEPQNPSTDAGIGWAFKSLDIDAFMEATAAFNAGRMILGKQGVSSVYVDPDQDITVEIGGLAQYFNAGVPDPTLATPLDGSDDYNSVTYSSPVYNYDARERDALNIKFGYTVAGEARPADTYGACYMRLGEEIDNLIEMLQAGYSERKDISRSTPNINIFDNFEAITAVENEEVFAPADSIERKSQMKELTRASASDANDGDSSYE
jgi:hypothetical protein